MTRMAVISFCWAITLLLHCCDYLNDPHADGGSGSDAEATVVVGQVVDFNGIPQPGVAVRLRETSFLAKLTIDSTEKESVKQDTQTLHSGHFLFNGIGPGMYSIEAFLNDSLGAFSTLLVSHGDSIIRHPADTLYPLAILTGNAWVESSAKATPTVQVFGLDRISIPDSTGQFEMKVPRGRHRLRIADDSLTYDEIDTLLLARHGRRHHIGRFRLGDRCQDYACDSTTMRNLLDHFGMDSITVKEVTRRDSSRIVEVYLRERGFRKMPHKLIKLKRLEVLDLGRNNITRVMLKPLKNLKKLILDGNRLFEIRPDIGFLKKLKALNLSDNDLALLPDAITRLNPEYLNLSNNRLCDVSDSVAAWADTLDMGWRERQRCPVE